MVHCIIVQYTIVKEWSSVKSLWECDEHAVFVLNFIQRRWKKSQTNAFYPLFNLSVGGTATQNSAMRAEGENEKMCQIRVEFDNA